MGDIQVSNGKNMTRMTQKTQTGYRRSSADAGGFLSRCEEMLHLIERLKI